MNRPSRTMIHMTTAVMWSSRSVCKRAKVGCVITTEDMRRVLSIGYNGPARNLTDDHCTGKEGQCGCLHAEDNAVAFVDSTIPNKIAFITMTPCRACAQRLVQANVRTIYIMRQYRDDAGLSILRECEVQVKTIRESIVRDFLSCQVRLLQ